MNTYEIYYRDRWGKRSTFSTGITATLAKQRAWTEEISRGKYNYYPHYSRKI